MLRASGPATAGHRRHAVIDSPLGPLTVVADDGAVTGLWMDGQRHRPPDATFGERSGGPGVEPFDEVASQLGAYFDRRLTAFRLPLRLVGTEFQRKVWDALLAVPYGTTVSYGELARRIGHPAAVRAVGAANGRNPVGIVVPCHRVVGATGGLTGYGGGLDRKRRLLALEAGLPLDPTGTGAGTGTGTGDRDGPA